MVKYYQNVLLFNIMVNKGYLRQILVVRKDLVIIF